jgi:hypothetical protein
MITGMMLLGTGKPDTGYASAAKAGAAQTRTKRQMHAARNATPPDLVFVTLLMIALRIRQMVATAADRDGSDNSRGRVRDP